jgi:hypothetical protein
VALSNLFPEVKSVGQWLRHGWHIPIAYVAGFFALLLPRLASAREAQGRPYRRPAVPAAQPRSVVVPAA